MEWDIIFKYLYNILIQIFFNIIFFSILDMIIFKLKYQYLKEPFKVQDPIAKIVIIWVMGYDQWFVNKLWYLKKDRNLVNINISTNKTFSKKPYTKNKNKNLDY